MNAPSTPPRDAPDRVCLGVIAGAHGVRGDFKIKTFTADETDVASYGPVETEDARRRFVLKILRVLKPGLVLATAQEIQNREDAQALSGAKLLVPRDRLPPLADDDEFYMDDLVGLAAVDESGASAGRVAAVYNFGAGDILELRGAPGRKGALMIPFTRESTPTVDLAGGRIVVADEALALDNAEPDESGG